MIPIIQSLLDTDFYKFTMQQVVFHNFPDVPVRYKFKLRNFPATMLGPCYPRIKQEIDQLGELALTEDELIYLMGIGFLSDGYIQFLKNFRLDPEDVLINFDHTHGLQLEIEGTWLNTILFETPLLAIISECATDAMDTTGLGKQGESKLQWKIDKLHKYIRYRKKQFPRNFPLRIADFGTRRRFSKGWQEYVVNKMHQEFPYTFMGTSNVWLAKEYNLRPIGTMAHEYIQAMQALTRVKDSQKFAFQMWANEYRGNLGIALSDTLGMKAFLGDFDQYFCKLFDGARHDSGDPERWGNRMIEHYWHMGIDPAWGKTLVFSDGLTVDKILRLHALFSSEVRTSFGWGTNLTNDVGVKPMQIVIKMVECDGQPVAKIADSPGKQMCEDQQYLEYLRKTFKIGTGET